MLLQLLTGLTNFQLALIHFLTLIRRLDLKLILLIGTTMLTHSDHGGLILIIDDSVDNIKLLSTVLHEEADLIFATNGKKGLSLAQERNPDVILLDINMPGISGFDVCQQLKQNPTTADAAIIFVTAHNSEEHELKALEAGAVDYITKPINTRLAKARITAHLKSKRHTDLLRLIANRDGLTNLYNRRFFDEQIDEEWRRHLRHGWSLALALIDIDHFKLFNDNYGHQAGDTCLIKVAKTIQDSTARAGEIVARYGGEEIAVILPNTNTRQALAYGEFICQTIQSLQMLHDYSPTSDYISVSVGVSSMDNPALTTPEKLIALADKGLYLAKEQGRNQAVAIDLAARSSPELQHSS